MDAVSAHMVPFVFELSSPGSHNLQLSAGQQKSFGANPKPFGALSNSCLQLQQIYYQSERGGARASNDVSFSLGAILAGVV